MSKLLYSSSLHINLEESTSKVQCKRCTKDFKDLKHPAKITVHRYYPCRCKDVLSIPEFINQSYLWE